MRKKKFIYPKGPKKRGKINIYPEISRGNSISIHIIGNPDGLKYLADWLNFLANFDLNQTDDPIGSREHFHFHPTCQLNSHSCEVIIWRADANGTRELPDFMD